MKFPRNRANCYGAIRENYDSVGNLEKSALCGVFADYAECEDYCSAMEQEWREKRGYTANVVFRPVLSTFYG